MYLPALLLARAVPAQRELPGTRPTPQGGADVDEATPYPSPGSDPAIAGAIIELRTELAELRSELAREVRTRKLVVVEDDGRERIVLIAGGDHGTCTVAVLDSSDEPTQVELFALDADDMGPAYIGLELVQQGNGVAGFAVAEGGRANLWEDPQ